MSLFNRTHKILAGACVGSLSVFLIILFCSFIASIILTYQTKSPIPLAVPGSLLISMRPIIRYLFGR